MERKRTWIGRRLRRPRALLGAAVALIPLLVAGPSGAADPPPVFVAGKACAPKLFHLVDSGLAVDADGHPHAAYGGDHLYYARRDASGWHVETADGSPGCGNGASLALDGAGAAHIAHHDNVNGRLLYTTDAGGSWATEVVDPDLMLPGFDAFTLMRGAGRTCVGIGPSGRPHLAYRDPVKNLLVLAVREPSGWRKEVVSDRDNPGQNLAMALDAKGAVHLAWGSDDGPHFLEIQSAQDLYVTMFVRYATNASGTWRTETIDDHEGTMTIGLQPGQGISLALDSGGTPHLVYVDNDGLYLSGRLQYATKGGGGWTTETLLPSTERVEDASLAADGTDALHVAYASQPPGENRYEVGYLTGSPGAWGEGGTVEPDSQRMTLALGPGGEPHIACLTNAYGYRQTLRHIEGSPGAWTATDVDETNRVGLQSALAIDAAGAAHAVHLAGNEVWYTSDASGEWASEPVAQGIASLGAGNVAVASDGTVHVAYLKVVAENDCDLFLATRTGGAWTRSAIETGLGVVYKADLALDAKENVHVAYNDAAAGAMKVTSNATGAWVDEAVAPTVRATQKPSLAIAADGVRHLAWHDTDSDEVVYATDRGGAWTSEVVEVVESTSVYPSLATDSNGAAWLLFSRLEGYRLVLATNASGAWETSPLPLAEDLYGQAALAVDGDDRFHVAVQGVGGRRGQLLYLTNRSGEWTRTVVDTGEGGGRQFLAARIRVREDAGRIDVPVIPSGFSAVGAWPSIALDAEGRVRIAYYDATLGDLRSAREVDAPPAADVTVSYRTAGGTAAAGEDYTAVAGTFGWREGDSAARTISIPLADDAIAEGQETIRLELHDPTGGLILGAIPTATVVVEDEEAVLEGAVAGYLLPSKLAVKLNAAKPEKSKLVAAGFFDTGPGPLDLGGPATLAVGDLEVEIPEMPAAGAAFRYRGDGVDFLVKPSKTGSSRAKFKLVVKRDLTGRIDIAAPISIRFAGGSADGAGEVALTAGKYKLGKVRGALAAPSVFLYKAKAKVKGAGQDSVKLVAGLATLGRTPAEAPRVRVVFSGAEAVMEPAAFVRKGDRFVGKAAAPGITKATLDYAREQLVVTLSGLDLGGLPEGPQPVTVVIDVGGEERAVSVRMVRTGNAIRY